MNAEELPSITWTWEGTTFRADDQSIGPPIGVDPEKCRRAILPIVGAHGTVWIEKLRDGRPAVKEVHPHVRPGVRHEVTAALQGIGLSMTE